MPPEIARALALASALACGFLTALWTRGVAARWMARAKAGSASSRTGRRSAIVRWARDEHVRQRAGSASSFWSSGVLAAHTGWMADAVRLAGLSGEVSEGALCAVRAKVGFGCAAAGLLVGASLSNELAALLCVAGAAIGVTSTSRALKAEATLRARELERSLPEMLEVVSLGLRSGLSFERSFELYYRHFDGMLSQAAEAAHRRWTMGFATREQALRDMAATYDSKLLARLVESVVRSLRFGSSLADGLDALAAEAREVRKTRLQEAIAKAPVKMMLPTGTLILPAMLLLVLGPVLLELMEGF
ncbi:MAG TPA: type II secretion system F family protein [Candidatus Aveggerthella excrementigallinarum]|nr:type II secretion system F family protein [Candidatus Aveggerthella excrementigallinarum]